MEGGTNVRITHIPTRGTVGAFGPLRACAVLALTPIFALQDRHDLEGGSPAALQAAGGKREEFRSWFKK